MGDSLVGNVLDVQNYKCLTCSKCLIICHTNTIKPCEKHEPNNDKIGKKITVIMNTYRRSDKYLAEAIESFQRQTYRDAVLQITNTHPTPLKLDKDYDNVVIYNIKDVFGQYPRHAVWSVFRVKTPYFTILDDDDIYMPSYLQEFNEIIKHHTDKYIQVIRNKRIVDDNGKISKIECGGWGGRLLSRFKVADLQAALRKKPFNSYQGVDNFLTWKTHSGRKIKATLPPTYITRRQSDVAHIYKRLDNKLKVVQGRIGKSKKTAYSGQRLKVLTPHWGKDYIKEYSKYV